MTKTVHETELKYTQVGLEGITKQLETLMKVIDALPEGGKKSNAAIQGILNTLKELRSNTLDKSLDTPEAIAGVKQLQTQLKALTALTKAVELFKDADTNKALAQARALEKVEKSYAALLKATQLKDGTLGLAAETERDAKKAESVLQAHLANRLQMLRESQLEYNRLTAQARRIEKPKPEDATFIAGQGFVQTNPNAGRLDALRTRIAELKNIKAELSGEVKTLQKNLEELARVQTVKLEEKLKAAEEVKKSDFRVKSAPRLDPREVLGLPSRDEMKSFAASLKAQMNEDLNTESLRVKSASRIDPRTLLGLPSRDQMKSFAASLKAQLSEDLNIEQLRAKSASKVDVRQLLNLPNRDEMKSFAASLKAQMNEDVNVDRIYKSHNLIMPKVQDSITANEKIRALTAQIVAEHQNLLRVRKENQGSSAEELRILEKIQQIVKQRSQEEHAQSMVQRAGGERGAALLAVQAALMANYSVINTVTGSIRAALSTSVELEAAFRNVQAVTATTNTEMKGLEDTIKKVAAGSKFTSMEVAQAALTLGQAGLSAQQVGEALQAVVTLASASGTTIAQAVDLTTSIVGVFDKKSTDVADIANKVTQAANSSKVSVEKLALGFQYAGNTAAQMGISFEEVTAAMAAMSNAGIKNGSTMGTGLRSFLTEVQKPSQEFIETLQRIGLSLSDVDFRAHGLLGVTRRLREAGFVASDAMKSFDIRGAAAFNAMIGNPEEMERQYRLMLQTSAGVEANAIQMDSLKAQATRLTTSLGNLASAGFEPLGRLLATITGGLASMIQAASEAGPVIGVLGSAVAGLMAGGAVSYLASLTGGFAKFIPVLDLTTLSLQGVTLAWKEFSLATQVGVILFAVTAAWQGLSWALEYGKRKIDQLSAAFNTSKGSMEETAGTVQSLDAKISDLNYRAESLKNNQEALKTVNIELTSQFGAFGYQIDKNNLSFETMVDKLRKVRTEMEKLRRLKLEDTLAKNNDLVQAQKEDLLSSLDRANGKALFGRGLSTDRNIQDLISKPALGLTADQQGIVLAAVKEIRSQDINNLDNVGSAKIILDKLVNNKALDGTIAGEQYERLVSTLKDVLEKSTNYRTSQAAGVELDAQRNKDIQFDKFNKQNNYRDKNGRLLTYQEYLDSQDTPGNLEMQTGSSKNPLEIYEKMVARQRKLQEFYDKEKARAEELKATNPVEAQFMLDSINKKNENRKNEVLSQANATEALAKIEYNDQMAILKKQEQHGRVVQSKEEQIEALQKQKDLEIRFRNRSELDKTRAKLNEQEISAKYDQAIENINDRRIRAQRDPNDNIKARSLTAQAVAKDQEARALEDSSKTVQSMEELDKILDEAMAKKVEANKLKIQAIQARQLADTKKPNYDAAAGAIEHKNEIEAAQAQGEAELKSFAANFVALYKAAAKRLDPMEKKIREAKEQITQARLDGEDRIFEAQQKPRELDLNLKYATSADVSMEVRRAAVKQRNLESLAAVRLELAENQKQLALYGDEAEGLLSDLRKAWESAKNEIEELRAKLSKETDPGKRALLTAQLEAANGERDKAFTAYRDGKTQRNKLRGENVSLTEKVFEAEKNFPSEDNLESYKKKVSDVFSTFKNNVAEMDVVATLGKGLAKVFDGLTDSIANTFMEIASGNKTTKEAFRDMSVAVIKSIMSIITQMLAMKAVQASMSYFGFSTAGAPMGSSVGGDIGATVATMAATGGYVNPTGSFDRVRKMASGGPITGGIRGRDSVPILAMPGEFVLNKRAVDAVGTDFLHSLNATTNSVVSETSSKMKDAPTSGGGIVNVYVVSPDQKPSGMNPKDIIVAVSDDIMRGGSVRRLIKQVQMGNA